MCLDFGPSNHAPQRPNISSFLYFQKNWFATQKKRHGKTWIPHFSTIEVDNYIPSISERSEVSWEQLAVNVWKMDLG